MTETVIVALISAGSSVLVAVTALVLNYRGFASMDARFASMDARFASLEASMNSRFASIEADLKEFYRMLADLDKRISKLEPGA
jgi:hypothetical protein